MAEIELIDFNDREKEIKNKICEIILNAYGEELISLRVNKLIIYLAQLEEKIEKNK